MSNNIKELDTSTFDEVVASSDKPLVVDFWAPWCGPCKAMTPILEELATEMGEQVQIAKVNVDHNGEIASRYEIRAIPTLLFFKGGQKVGEHTGLASKADLQSKIQSVS